MDVLVSACMSMYKHVGEGAEVAIECLLLLVTLFLETGFH